LFIACILCANLAAAQEEKGSAPWTRKYNEAALADTAGRHAPLALFNIAVRATIEGDYREAEYYFSRSIARGHNLFSSYVGKANAQRELGKTEDMLATLCEGMKAGAREDSLQREKVEAMYAAHLLAEGRARLAENNVEAAAEAYTLLTRMERARWKVDGLVALGTLYIVRGNAILKDAPASATARRRAAAAFKKSRDYLDRAAKRAPDDPRVPEARARLDSLATRP
jgi:pilus assembly protein Flp/PilA